MTDLELSLADGRVAADLRIRRERARTARARCRHAHTTAINDNNTGNSKSAAGEQHTSLDTLARFARARRGGLLAGGLAQRHLAGAQLQHRRARNHERLHERVAVARRTQQLLLLVLLVGGAWCQLAHVADLEARRLHLCLFQHNLEALSAAPSGRCWIEGDAVEDALVAHAIAVLHDAMRKSDDRCIVREQTCTTTTCPRRCVTRYKSSFREYSSLDNEGDTGEVKPPAEGPGDVGPDGAPAASGLSAFRGALRESNTN